MSWLLTFLLYGIPWQFQVAILALLLAGLFLLAVKLFGWQRVKPWVAPALALLALIGLGSKNRQQGYQDREEQEHVAVDKATDEFEAIHRKNEGLTDAEIDKKNDPWLRP